jgi:AraC family transcriptional regulator, alkane utilization regulator
LPRSACRDKASLNQRRPQEGEPAIDLLSDVLRVIRLKGALYVNGAFREPWCVAAPSGEELAQILSPESRHVAICHLIIEGRCWAQIPGGEPVALAAGDVVVMPHGDPHLLGSGLQHALPARRDAVEIGIPALNGVCYGGDGAATQVVCGWFAYERDITSPLMTALPPLFRTSIRQRPSGAWLEAAIRFSLSELASGRAGGDAIADKLAEVLFVETLRSYIDDLPPQQTGWLAGMRDPLVGRSIALLHEHPAQAWTVASLAQAVNVSRTVLAERFTALVGVPPMQYLMQWRVALAANLLRGSRMSLTRIAEQIGYESEAAFSRAFKREYGAPPGAWRRQIGANADAAATS